MVQVKVIGAGSIGNHLTHACRNKGWEVCVVDKDSEALERMRKEIYPSRYGAWDDSIQLAQPDSMTGEEFDLIIVGTPPDTHLSICLNELQKNPPKVLLVEKPLCTPDLDRCDELVQLAEQTGTKVCVGYNHTLNAHTKELSKWIAEGKLGKVFTMDANVREYWGGIFAAHPWLSGPSASYLGFWKRGGGACGEHSHGINNWQYFARILGKGRVTSVSATMEYSTEGNADYDSICQINLTTEEGFTGRVVQDVVTSPVDKSVTLFAEKGVFKWVVNLDSVHDGIVHLENGDKMHENRFAKKRPDDFKGEIDDLGRLLSGEIEDSPVLLQYGLETMMIIAAAHRSHELKRTIRIDYSKGYNLSALVAE